MSPWYIIGAIISLSIISAANFLHFAKLGIEIQGDGGALFWMSVIVLLNSIWIQYYWNKMRKQKKFRLDYRNEEASDLLIQ